MERDEQVSAGLEPVRRGRPCCLDPLAHRHQRVDHRVAHIVDPPLLAALGQKVLACLGRVGEQQARELVGHHTVDLLGHRPVERAQAGLHVPERDAELRGHERGGHGAVHVAGDEH